VNRAEFRAAYRMARLVNGFERYCLNDEVSSLAFALPVAAYRAALRWGDPLRYSHVRIRCGSSFLNRLRTDFSRPRLPA